MIPETAWDSIRSTIKDSFSFSEIKDLLGRAGLPVHKLAHLQQKAGGGATKGQLMDGIDGLYSELTHEERHRFVCHVIENSIALKPDMLDSFNKALEVIGWGITNGIPYPLSLQINVEEVKLPEKIKRDLVKSIQRYRDGDISGAITMICASVDDLTESFYNRYPLGNHKTDAYHERIAKSFRALENEYKDKLEKEKVSPTEVLKIWQNHSKSIGQAAYVLGSLRRFSDVHGDKEAPAIFAQRALDCSIFIIRSFF